jgi:uncharacterized SAM-binding protein YcdF (DUF218 family)
MNKSLKLNGIDDIELLAVLGHSNKSAKIEDPMTFDARIRCRAAGVLFKEKNVKKIALLGGGNDKVMKVAEGERMRNYLKEAFEISDEVMDTESEGVNTITDIVSILKKLKKEKIDQKRVVFITSDYNSVRVKMILEIMGFGKMAVFSSERILLESGDYYAHQAGEYMESEEYQNRLLYESYWIAKTVYDAEYTKQAREELEEEFTPEDYYKKMPRREMDNIERKS